jgi:hypothetical protein
VRLVEDFEKLEVPKTSDTVSRLVTYCKGLISYGNKGAVTALSHARSGDVTGPDPQECLAQVDRLVRSALLQSSEALCKLLEYLAHHTLNSPADHLKEYQIATEVLGRPADFDPQADSSVRMQVGRLRNKLIEYYSSAGVHDLILSFERKVLVPEQEAVREVVTHPLASASAQHRRMIAGLIVIVLAIGCCVALWIQNRAMHRALHEWQYNPAVAALWSGFLDANLDTDVVLSDTSFAMLQKISKQTFSLQDYVSHSYLSQLQAQDLSPEIRAVLSRVGAQNLSNSSVFRLAQHILRLDSTGNKMHLYHAREYTAALIKQDNVILLSSRIANPWDELFDSRLNFQVISNDSNDVGTVTNRAPAAGEQGNYVSTDSVGYCVVAYLPNPDSNGKVLLIEGTSSEATEAAGDFLLSEDKLSNFQKRLHTTQFSYFEVLLRTSQVRGTSLTATIEAYRVYPNLH